MNESSLGQVNDLEQLLPLSVLALADIPNTTLNCTTEGWKSFEDFVQVIAQVKSVFLVGFLSRVMFRKIACVCNIFLNAYLIALNLFSWHLRL